MTNFYKQQCIKSLHFLLVVLSSHTYNCLWLSWDHICWEILQTFPSSTWYTTDHHGLFSATTQPSAIMAENKLMAGGSKATWHRLNRSLLLPNLARILWLKTSQKHWTVETHVSIQRPRQTPELSELPANLACFWSPDAVSGGGNVAALSKNLPTLDRPMFLGADIQRASLLSSQGYTKRNAL